MLNTFLHQLYRYHDKITSRLDLNKDWTYIIDDSSSKLVIAANESIYDKVKHYVGKIGKVQRLLCLDIPDDHEESYNRWMGLVEEEEAVPPIQPSPEDLAVIIYTSGTTGNPKVS